MSNIQERIREAKAESLRIANEGGSKAQQMRPFEAMSKNQLLEAVVVLLVEGEAEVTAKNTEIGNLQNQL